MYHMVRSSMHTSQARDRLLAAAVRHALDAGIADLSLRQIAAAQVEAGADEPTARAEARLGVAVVRGLLLDLLATGDRAGTTEAYDRFLARAPGQASPGN